MEESPLTLAEVTAEFRQRFDEHDRRFDDHDRRFDEHDRRFDEHDRRFDEHDRRFDEHDRRFDAVEARLDRVEKALESNTETLTLMMRMCNERFADIDRRFVELRSFIEVKFEESRSDFRALWEMHKHHDHRLNNLEARVEVLERRG
jgi:chromosome segregation ATPase